MMDEFTIPTTVAAAEPAALRHRRLPLWFPSFAAAGGRPVRTTEGAHLTAAADEDEERMDSLWEDFNEEELLRHSSDALSELESEAVGPHALGPCCCAEMVLRASSRAGGCRRAISSVLLVRRLFKRLFVVGKAVAASRRRCARSDATCRRF